MKKLLLILLLTMSALANVIYATEVTIEEKITGLYVAFFNRAGDQEGVNWWKSLAEQAEAEGKNASSVLKELSFKFSEHPSFSRAYVSMGNQTFVEEIYKNTLGREGDIEGVLWWTKLLNEGLTRSDFVAIFVEAALTFDRNDPQYAGLSDADLNAAQLRQDLISNKVEVALSFTHQLGTLSNVTDNENPESDPTYLASIKIISKTVENYDTVTLTLDFLESIKENDDPIKAILHCGSIFDTILQTYPKTIENIVTSSMLDAAWKPDIAVRIIYLLPSNKEEEPLYRQALKDTYLDIQAWYLKSLNGEKTFALKDPVNVVDVIQSTQEEAWFSEQNGDDIWIIFNKVAEEAEHILGTRPDNEVWIIYADVNRELSECMSLEGGGGSTGLAVMQRDDLYGLTGEYDKIVCEENRNYNRWIGGGAHESGHAFGLPHPTAVGRNCQEESCLMEVGYADYPDTSLTEGGKSILLDNPVFSSIPLIDSVLNMAEKVYGLSHKPTRVHRETNTTVYYRYDERAGYVFIDGDEMYVYVQDQLRKKESWKAWYENCMISPSAYGIPDKIDTLSYYPLVDAGEDKNVTVGTLLSFEGNATDQDGEIIRYEWSEDGVVLSTESLFLYRVPDRLGVHTLVLSAIDNDGLLSSDTVTVTVESLVPQVDVGTDRVAEIWKEISIDATVTDSDGSIVMYQWTENIGGEVYPVSSGSASFVYVPDELGKHYFTLTVTDNDGMQAFDSMVLTVITAPNQAPSVDAGADSSVTVNTAVTLNGTASDSDGDIVSYEWCEGETVLSSSASFDYIPDTIDDHILTLTVIDDDGTISSDTVTVVVTESPEDAKETSAFNTFDKSTFLKSTCEILPFPDIRGIFVSVDGNSMATGTKNDTLDLATALSISSPVQDGETIWILEGTYRGSFTSELKGTDTQHISVRPMPGQRVIIDGETGETSALTVNGEWTDYYGLEVMSSATNRSSAERGSGPTDLKTNGGVTVLYGNNTCIINFIVHDNVGGGFASWRPASNSELYGNIIYNNGWTAPDRGHGHAIYAQNQVGYKKLTNNIIFFGYGTGIHVYTQGGQINGFDVQKNTWFMTGASDPRASQKKDNCLIGGFQPVLGLRLKNNQGYSQNSRGTRIGYGGSVEGQDAILDNNYLSENLWIAGHWDRFDVSNTSILRGIMGSSQTYINNIAGNNFQSSPPVSGKKIFVNANAHDARRAKVVIYNYDEDASVPVDLSSVLKLGEAYRIHSVFDLFSVPLIAGVYDGGNVEIPMGSVAAPQPIGNNNISDADDPKRKFGTFIVTHAGCQ